MKVLFQIRKDVTHNNENSCRSIKMMLRKDIDALRSLCLKKFLFVLDLTKNRRFSETIRFSKKINHFH